MAITSAERFDVRNLQTLTSAVQREVERRILAGEIEAGTRLSEAGLASELGVSRGPVREAMRGLVQAGLVDSIANRGIVVRKIGLDEALDLYALRGVIFGLACEALAKRRTAEQLEALERDIAEMAAAVGAGDKQAYYHLNLAFHARILEACGNRRARSTYESVVKEMHLFRRRGLSGVGNIGQSLDEHRAIVAAISDGDPERAFAAGRDHVRQGCERFRRSLEQEDDPALA